MGQSRDDAAEATTEDVEWLFRAYSRLVRTHLSTIGAPADVVDDLCQDTFVRLLVAVRPAELKSPQAYLRSAATAAFIDWQRKVGRQRRLVGRLAGLAESRPAEASMSTPPSGDILTALSPLDRAVVRLRSVLGWPFEDIGRAFSQTSGWARVRHHRALKQLRAHASDNREGE